MVGSLILIIIWFRILSYFTIIFYDLISPW